MAYEPTVWQTGDVITAAKLNKAEQGIADANLLVVFTDNDGTITASETFATVLSALEAGSHVMFKFGHRLLYMIEYNEPQPGDIPLAGAFHLRTPAIVSSTRVTQMRLDWEDSETINITNLQYPSEIG